MDRRLRDAYLATDYHVDAEPPVAIRVGQHDPAVRQLLRARQAQPAAFLTAWNPARNPVSLQENTAAHKRLAAAVTALGCATAPARGIGRGGQWPPEESLLVLGIGLDDAMRLARDFGQNAFVWLDRDEAPELLTITD